LDQVYHFLLAEDDPDDQMIANDALKKAFPGVRIHTAHNGNEALEYLKRSQELPHVLITDIQMPEKTGFELLQALKEVPALKKIPVVILSTSKEPSDIQKGKRLGAVLYITKPELFDDWVKVLKQISSLLPA
jgi:chemotaxis family two-component system response regulator Rcp1